MKSYFVTVDDDTNKKVQVNVAHIKYYFAEKHYGKDVTTITFEQGTLKVQQAPDVLAGLIKAAQQD